MPSTRKDIPARRHARVRKQHSNELAQDYVEAIQSIADSGREPRVIELQEVFGVSHVSVIRALKRIEEKGLLERSENGGILLSQKGRSLAKESAGRHDLVVRFLEALGVSPLKAQADAEGIEHHISSETLQAFEKFLADKGS